MGLFDIIGSIAGGLIGESGKKKEIAAQKEFAQNGIQWKVADAEKAGIHPLYALGANTISYSPVGVGDSLGAAVQNAGQDISRSVAANSTDNQRATMFTRAMQQLQLQRAGLENDLLASQIAKVRQPGTGPAMPGANDRYLVDGQGDTRSPPVAALLNVQPQDVVATRPGQEYQEPGTVPDRSFARTGTGLAPVYSNDVANRLEDDLGGMIGWNIRNRVVPSIESLGGYNSRKVPGLPVAPVGKTWWFNYVRQQYELIPMRSYGPHGQRGKSGRYDKY